MTSFEVVLRHCSKKQVLDRIAYPAKAAPEDSGAVAASFNHIRDLVLGGYYSSEMGITELQYQGNKMLESWDGCPDSAISQLWGGLQPLGTLEELERLRVASEGQLGVKGARLPDYAHKHHSSMASMKHGGSSRASADDDLACTN